MNKIKATVYFTTGKNSATQSRSLTTRTDGNELVSTEINRLKLLAVNAVTAIMQWEKDITIDIQNVQLQRIEELSNSLKSH